MCVLQSFRAGASGVRGRDSENGKMMRIPKAVRGPANGKYISMADVKKK